MSVRVEINKTRLQARFAAGKKMAEAALAEQVLSDSTNFVPSDGESTLRDSGRPEVVGGDQAVTWNTPYAAYQFYGCWPDGSHQIVNHTTSGTTIQWTETAKQRYAEDWRKVSENAYKKGMG